MRTNHHGQKLCTHNDIYPHLAPCDIAVDDKPSPFLENKMICRKHRVEQESEIKTWDETLNKLAGIEVERTEDGSHFHYYSVRSKDRDFHMHLTIETVYHDAPEIVSVYLVRMDNHERRQYAVAADNWNLSDLLYILVEWVIAQQNELLL